MSAETDKHRVEWLPWSELNSSQRIGRMGLYGAGLLVLFAAAHTLVGVLVPATRAPSAADVSPAAPIAPLTDAERKTGIETLCKVFQIYRIPKTDEDADAAAKNAAELFKLEGDPSPARTGQILTAVSHQFSAGQLTAADCAASGQPLPTQATRAQ